jgi:hypothetical protein
MSAYETVVNSLYEVKDWGRLEVLQEVFEWLENNFFTGEIDGYYSDVPEHIVQGKFDDKEQMLNAFKTHFNIE